MDWIVPPGSVSDGPVLLAIDAVPNPTDVPIPTGDADAWIFAHLYEGLFEQQGSAFVPRLAKSCRMNDDRECTVELASGLSFSDGTRLQAEDVVDAWMRTNQRHPFEPIWQWLDPAMAQVSGNRIRIPLSAPLDPADIEQAMALLSHPALRIYSPRPGMPYPVGTGPLLVGSSSGREVRCGSNPHHVAGGQGAGASSETPRWRDGKGREVVFRVTRRSDPRDLVDSEFDGAWVRQREAIPFMEDVGWLAHPLPWDRLYVLRWPSSKLPAIDRQELAGITVGAESRPAQGRPVEGNVIPFSDTSQPLDAKVSGLESPANPRSLGGEEQERARRLLKEHGYEDSSTEDSKEKRPPADSQLRPNDPTSSTFPSPNASDAVFCVRGDKDGERIAARLTAVVGSLHRVVTVLRGELLHGLRAGSATDRAGLSYDAPGPSDGLVFAVRSDGAGAFQVLDLGPRPVGRIQPLVETRGRFVSAPTISGIYVDGRGVPRVEYAAKRVIGYGSAEVD